MRSLRLIHRAPGHIGPGTHFDGDPRWAIVEAKARAEQGFVAFAPELPVAPIAPAPFPSPTAALAPPSPPRATPATATVPAAASIKRRSALIDLAPLILGLSVPIILMFVGRERRRQQ